MSARFERRHPSPQRDAIERTFDALAHADVNVWELDEAMRSGMVRCRVWQVLRVMRTRSRRTSLASGLKRLSRREAGEKTQ